MDKDSNVATTTVTVTYYKPQVPKESIAQEEISTPSEYGSGVFEVIAGGKLGDYMEKLDRKGFKDFTELYNYLLEHAAEQGFTKEEIDKMFSVFFTQKDMDLFDLEFRQFAELKGERYSAVKDSSSIPLQYLDNLLRSGMLIWPL